MFFFSSLEPKAYGELIGLDSSRHPSVLLSILSNMNTSTRFVQIMPLGSKMALPQGHIFYIGLYRENMKKSSCLKPQGLEL